MDDRQREFLLRIAALIPRLFDEIGNGNASSEFTLGVRLIRQRRVRLLIRVEVIDPGNDPMRTHGMQPVARDKAAADAPVPPNDVPGRRRARRKSR